MEEGSLLSPRSNSYLLGHKTEEDFLQAAFDKNSLHSSWLISGLKGIGKATFAYKFARFLLKDDGKLVARNAHPDMKVIERDYTETDKRKIIKAIKEGSNIADLGDLKRSSFIKVDEVRAIGDFLSKKASNDGYRVVLIDSIDDMNGSSANALLKILEEPPYKTVMLLISHNPEKLLPTIRSRCAKLNLKPLEDGEVASLIRRYRPETSEADIKKVVKLCGGSIGKALNYIDNSALENYDKLNKIIEAGGNFKLAELFNLCDEAAKDEELYALTQELALKALNEKMKKTGKPEETASVWEQALCVFDDTLRLNMDKKQALFNVINSIARV